MPKPVCLQCKTTDSFIWRSFEGNQICNDCHVAKTEPKEQNSTSTAIKMDVDVIKEEKDDPEYKNDEETTPAKATGKGTRKSTRATRYKPKTPASVPKTPAPRGRGRRSLFKRPPLKAPTATATVVTSESLFYKGSYIQVGDIVSVLDIGGGTYYAQIRGLMTDQYCEKSAVLTWLLPTKASPPPEERFDPATYIIGPEEELPRKLEYMDFIMHAPSDYYKASNQPYSLNDRELNEYSGFIWTSLEPKDRT